MVERTHLIFQYYRKTDFRPTAQMGTRKCDTTDGVCMYASGVSRGGGNPDFTSILRKVIYFSCASVMSMCCTDDCVVLNGVLNSRTVNHVPMPSQAPSRDREKIRHNNRNPFTRCPPSHETARLRWMCPPWIGYGRLICFPFEGYPSESTSRTFFCCNWKPLLRYSALATSNSHFSSLSSTDLFCLQSC